MGDTPITVRSQQERIDRLEKFLIERNAQLAEARTQAEHAHAECKRRIKHLRGQIAATISLLRDGCRKGEIDQRNIMQTVADCLERSLRADEGGDGNG